MQIPETEPSSIDQAIELALERTRGQFKIELELAQLRNLKPQLMAVLKKWPGEVHPRGVNLFFELWAIAQISRLANGEPPLKDKQISDFLDRCLTFFNCFFCR